MVNFHTYIQKERIIIPPETVKQGDIIKEIKRIIFNGVSYALGAYDYYFDNVHELTDYLGKNKMDEINRIHLNNVVIQELDTSEKNYLSLTLTDANRRAEFRAIATKREDDRICGLIQDEYELLKTSEGKNARVTIRRYESDIRPVNYITSFDLNLGYYETTSTYVTPREKSSLLMQLH